MSTLSRQ